MGIAAGVGIAGIKGRFRFVVLGIASIVAIGFQGVGRVGTRQGICRG